MAKRRSTFGGFGGTRKRLGRGQGYSKYLRHEARRTRYEGDLYRAAEEERREKADRRYRRGTKLPKGVGKGRFCIRETTPKFHWNTDAFIGTESKILRCFTKRRDALKHVRRLAAGEEDSYEQAKEFSIVAPDYWKRGRTPRRHGKKAASPPARPANPDDIPF
jgi:hypothetical protein